MKTQTLDTKFHGQLLGRPPLSIIFLFMVCSATAFVVGCDRNRKAAVVQQDAPPKTAKLETNHSAALEEYERVSPADLDFVLRDKSTFIEQEAGGNVRGWAGTWESFHAEGGIGNIELANNQIAVEDGCGIIVTKNFGKIRITVPAEGPVFWLKPSQKEALMKLKKEPKKDD